jgi:arylsulfatase A-like enzyme
MAIAKKHPILWLLIIICAVSACERQGSKNKKPGVIIFMVDALRADGLGCYGNPEETSPYMDHLAEKGIRFSEAFSHSTHTKLSIASLFSGLIPPSNGIRSSVRSETSFGRLPEDIVTMAEAFERTGYFTCGLSTNPLLKKETGFAQGFEYFYYVGGADPKKSVARVVNRSALDLLKLSDGRPFFLYLHYMDVHYPYQPTRRYREFFIKEIKDYQPYYMNAPHEGEMTDEKVAYTRAFYHGAVRYWDDELRRFMTALDRAGHLDNVIVLITSDHGEEFYEHKGFGHNYTVYDETLRVPLIMVWPGKIPEGLERKDMAGLIDVFPTIAGLAGIDVSGLPLQGRDLFASGMEFKPESLTGKETPILYAETFRIKVPRCLRTPNRKLIYNQEAASFEYYLLDQDPGELTDLYDPDDPKIKELSTRLKEMMDRPPLFESETGAGKRPGPASEGMDPETVRALKSLGYVEF